VADVDILGKRIQFKLASDSMRKDI
jgi:hypothetical protein